LKTLGLCVALLSLFASYAIADDQPSDGSKSSADNSAAAAAKDYFTPGSVSTSGSVSVEGAVTDYQAVAGTLVIHPKGWDDSAKPSGKDGDSDNPDAEASMFYAAYFKKGVPPGQRPVMFIYNGGPGSASVWLHMGAFGPMRVVTADDSHTPAAPYSLINNQYSLLDVSDLVFIDAPGAGFSRTEGKDKDKKFFGVDQDAHAFAEFIQQFLTKYSRWNSPKYLFGESYGTPRSAVLINQLENDRAIDFNGVVMLSQILNFDLSPDQPELNPGVDLPYVIALPTYAATAWYHNKLPGAKPADLPGFLHQVEAFSTSDYLLALQAGSGLDDAKRNAIADKLHQYTGLPVSYILKANLRIDGGEFEKNLQDDNGLTTGRLDTRFSGPSLDVLSKEADYDPQDSAIASAYTSAFNDYVRTTLKYPADMQYKLFADTDDWDFTHQPPNADSPQQGSVNVMPDLADAMKQNPNLKIMLNGGYFDLATPYYEGWYEMHHLVIPPSLQSNIEYHYYQSGHMVYAHEPALKELHDNVAAFVRKTDNLQK